MVQKAWQFSSVLAIDSQPQIRFLVLLRDTLSEICAISNVKSMHILKYDGLRKNGWGNREEMQAYGAAEMRKKKSERMGTVDTGRS